jgi:hypothetical protein
MGSISLALIEKEARLALELLGQFMVATGAVLMHYTHYTILI